MKCVRCKHGSISKKKVNVKLERNGSIVIVKDVPAMVCDECGETYFDSAITKLMHNTANKALNDWMEIAVVHLAESSVSLLVFQKDV